MTSRTIRTINEVFYAVVDRDLDSPVLTKRNGKWASISSREFYRNVVGVARSLESWGFQQGDRVAILSENRSEWAVTDFAAMAIGGVTVPIYATLTAEQTLYMLRNSGARAIFVSTNDQLRKVLSIKDRSCLEKIVVMDYVATADAIPMQHLMQMGPTERDAQFDTRARSFGPEQLATIIYTSGTTGTPKGAMLTQGNLASNLLHSLDLYDFKPNQISISFLPLSHITARHVDYAMFWHGVTIAYCPFIEEILQCLHEIKPHFFVAVPRVYEKMYNQVQSKIGGGFKRKLYDWAMGVGHAHKDEVLASKKPSGIEWKLADLLVFSKIKKALGGRVEIFISGGAPLNRELIDWYGGIGIRIHEGYGLTETSPVIALNNPRAYCPGSVGKPLKNVEVRIAEDGEIMVKGPSVFKGYWNLPEETRQAFEGEWFHTGDIGRIDEGGFLYVTDRKKDLIKTSGGKFICPQPIEAKLKANVLVGEVAIIGERRKFPSVIVAPHFPALEDWAKSNGVTASTREQLVSDPRVQSLYRGIVSDVNQGLAQYEKVKKLLLVNDEFTIANGTLTPTMKLKRRVVEERYRGAIEELYEASAEVRTVA